MKRLLFVGFIICLIILAVFTYNMLNSAGKPLTDAQKYQALVKILGRKPNITDTTPKGNKIYRDKYTSFYYPASAVIYKYRDPNISKDASVLAIFSFDISNPRLIFNYSVIAYSNSIAKISDIPDVRLRQLQRNLYTQETVFADNKEGLAFEKQGETGNIEKSVFFFFGGKEYSFSIQGTDQKGVDNLYNLILAGIKFL